MEKINYSKYENIVLEEILPLYKDVGWSNYFNNEQMLLNAYKNSLYIYGAYNEQELIGIIRVVGDGHSIIYIQDIIVKEKYQRKGIGTHLLRYVLEKYDNTYQTVLLTDDSEKTKLFYESVGLSESSKFDCVSFIKFNI